MSRQVIDNMLSTISYACCLSGNSILCYGRLSHRISEQDTITVNGCEVKRPYLGIVIREKDATYVALVLTIDSRTICTYLDEVVISSKNSEISWRFEGEDKLLGYSGEFVKFFKNLSNKGQQRILYLMYRFMTTYPDMSKDGLLSALCYQARSMQVKTNGSISKAFWVLPNVLFQECSFISDDFHPEAYLVASAPKKIAAAKTQLFKLPSKSYSNDISHCFAVSIFAGGEFGAIKSKSKNLNLSYFSPEHFLAPVQGVLPKNEADEASLLAYMQTLDDADRYYVRENIARVICDNIDTDYLKEASVFLKNIQHYIPSKHTSITDKENPFGMNIENVVPIGNEAVFVSGWARDPLSILENIEVVSDLGYSFPLKDHMVFYNRPAIDEMYEGSTYGGHKGAWGFVAYVPVSQDLSRKISQVAELKSFRFSVKLAGGLQYYLTSQNQLLDEFSARDLLLKQVAPLAAESAKAEECVHKAVAKIHAKCMQNVVVRSTVTLGSVPEKPLVSVVIPLYKCLDFIKVQVAHFSNDPYMHKCQIIYVLDSPEQEEQVTQLLKEISVLYGLPLELAVMQRNYGYAMANNAGAMLARAQHVLFLDSDIIPSSYGWLQNMHDYYLAQENIGALGAKLLYEDEAIQHAGMYFKLVQGGKYRDRNYYQNKYYHKGYPKNRNGSVKSKVVPAVSGACMMIEKSFFSDIGRFSAEYVIAGFEDSDLCLSSIRRGRQNHLVTGVELYHLEQQSISLNDNYHPSATFMYNAIHHYNKWGRDITAVMKDCEVAC